MLTKIYTTTTRESVYRRHRKETRERVQERYRLSQPLSRMVCVYFGLPPRGQMLT